MIMPNINCIIVDNIIYLKHRICITLDHIKGEIMKNSDLSELHNIRHYHRSIMDKMINSPDEYKTLDMSTVREDIKSAARKLYVERQKINDLFNQIDTKFSKYGYKSDIYANDRCLNDHIVDIRYYAGIFNS
jgi:hypothetical protein